MSMISEQVEELREYARISKLINSNYSRVMSQAADTIEMLSEKCRNTNQWISCKERLPEKDGEYFVTVEKSPSLFDNDNKFITTMYFQLGEWLLELEGFGVKVLAWMPLDLKPYSSEYEG